jgi:hypothetical protein
MQQAPPLMITNDHVNLLSVSGRMDGSGLRTLQQQINLLLDACARFLLADLSRGRALRPPRVRPPRPHQHPHPASRRLAATGRPGDAQVGTVEETAPAAALPMDLAAGRTDRAIGYA